jgi:phosphatidylserine/phosphatidylglycerophosphate/cardiolipin synthase-like enzyme
VTRPLLVPGETCAALVTATSSGLLIDGRDFFRAVHDACSQAERTICMAGWQFASDVELLRGDDVRDPAYPSSFLDFLRALCARKPALEIYLLPWDSSPVFAFEREPLQRLKFRRKGHPRIHWRMDNCHPPGASHHQKLITVDRSIGFVGGMDVCTSRWDDRQHRADQKERCTHGRPDGPYHDVQAYVTGEAVDVLRRWFAWRWQRATSEPLTLPDAAPRDLRFTPTLPVHAPRIGLARTIPAMDDPPTRPVTELLQLHLRAIGQARRVIYLENQYLSSDELCRALEARLDAGAPRLEIAIVLPERSAGFKERISIGVYQQAILESLGEAAARNGHALGVYYHAACGPDGDVPVFIHAKVLAVDDRFLLVSSANLTNRSMSFDSELGIAWESRGPTPSLRRARIELLGEHCGLARDEAEPLVGPIDGLVARLDRFARSRTGALRIHRRNVDEKPGWLLSRLLPPETPFDPDTIEDLLPEPGAWLDRLLRDPVRLVGHSGRRLGHAVRTRRKAYSRSRRRRVFEHHGRAHRGPVI